MARDLKFDWSIQATCKRSVLVNQAHLGIFPGIAARKLTNTPAVICSYPCRGRWFISKKQIIVLIESLFTATCRGSSKQVFLKCFTQSRGKQLRRSLVSISQQPATFLRKGFDIDAFLWILRNCQEHLGTPDSVFIEHICRYNNLQCNVNQPRWLFEPFVETLINIETSYEIILFLLF